MRAALIAGGVITPGPDTPLADLADVAGMLVAAGRVPPPGRWVDSLVVRAQAERVSRMPHNLC